MPKLLLCSTGMFLEPGTCMAALHRSSLGMPSLKESWLSRGVFRIFSDGFSFIAHIASTSKPVGFVFQSSPVRLPSCCRSFFSGVFGGVLGDLHSVSGVAPGPNCGSDRRRSFPGDCTPSHPFVNTALLRGAAGPPCQATTHGIIFCDHPANQARLNHPDVDQSRARSIEWDSQAGRGPRGS